MAAKLSQKEILDKSSKLVSEFRIRGKTPEDWYNYFRLEISEDDNLEQILHNNAKISGFVQELGYYISSARLRSLALEDELNRQQGESRTELVKEAKEKNNRLSIERLNQLVEQETRDYSTSLEIAKFELAFWEQFSKTLDRLASRVDKQVMANLSDRKHNLG